MNAIFMIVNDPFVDVASAHALHLVNLWQCDVHIFIERRDPDLQVREVSDPRIIYHYDRLMGFVPSGLPGTKRWPNIVYCRFFAPLLLTQYTRLMHLDADMLCLKADPSVWDIDLPSGLGAVPEFATWDRDLYARMGTTPEDWMRSVGVHSGHCLNGGFLMIDPQRFNQHDYAALLPQYFARFPNAKQNDQDFLNHFFDGSWTQLGPRFNFQARLMQLGYLNIVDPVILHFNRRIKPWHGRQGDWCEAGSPADATLFDPVMSNAGFAPAEYHAYEQLAWERRVKYSILRRLARNGIVTKQERRSRKDWARREANFRENMNTALAEHRYADERRTSLPPTPYQPEFDGRFANVHEPVVVRI